MGVSMASIAVTGAMVTSLLDDDVPCFEITDVARMVDEKQKNDSDSTTYSVKDYPCLRPPFETTWFEYASGFVRVGTIVNFISTEEAQDLVDRNRDKGDTSASKFFNQVLAVKGHVVCFAAYLCNMKSGAITGPMLNVFIPVNDAGKPLDFSLTLTAITGLKGLGQQSDLVGLCNPVFQALSLLHCKNVATETKEVATTINERHRRKHPPLVTYRMLKIRPAGGKRFSQLATPGTPGDTETPYHICRGHFKTFDEKPLLGRVKGTFWWADHARGDRKHGQVIKDYSVSPSDDKPTTT
jgi:hypothetical protein